MKHYIIDAHNVLHKMDELKLHMKYNIPTAEKILMDYINKFADRYPSWKFTVVFDGHAKLIKKLAPNVYILNSGRDKADSIINDLVSFAENPKHYYVVSSDHEIQNYAKKCNCNSEKSEDFIISLKNKDIKTLRTQVRYNKKKLYEIFEEEKDIPFDKSDMEDYREAFMSREEIIEDEELLEESLDLKKLKEHMEGKKKHKIKKERKVKAKKSDKPTDISKDEIDRMMKEFGFDK